MTGVPWWSRNKSVDLARTHLDKTCATVLSVDKETNGNFSEMKRQKNKVTVWNTNFRL